MTRALNLLGLPRDADERAVKRAYAQRLKQVRPDTDPEGFQRLHEAYRAALAYVQARAFEGGQAEDDESGEVAASADESADEDSGDASVRMRLSAIELDAILDDAILDEAVLDEAVVDEMPSAQNDAFDRAGDAGPASAPAPLRPAAVSLDAVPEPSQTLDVEAFIEDCIDRLREDSPEALLAWLRAQPALWSLQLKPRIGHWVLHELQERQPPVAEASFDAFMKFFDLDHVLAGTDPYLMQRLRERMQLAWELQPGHQDTLAERLPDGGSAGARRRETRRMMRQLTQPLRWPQPLWYGLGHGRPAAIRRFLLALDNGEVDRLPPPIEPSQVQFWMQAGDVSRLSPPRWAIGTARCAVYGLGIALVAILGRLLSAGEDGQSWLSMLVLVPASVLTLLAAWMAWLGWRAFAAWQGADESHPVRWPWLQLGLIPMLAAAAVVLRHGLGWEGAASAVVVLALPTAIARYRRRNAPDWRYRFRFWHLLMAVPLAKMLAVGLGILLLYSDVGAAAVLLLWLIDAVRQRKALAARWRKPAAMAA